MTSRDDDDFLGWLLDGTDIDDSLLESYAKTDEETEASDPLRSRLITCECCLTTHTK